MKKRGFTLVELLVVISIIALLMGILVPALARARALAYQMVCSTNLGGIGKAMILYSQDSEGEFPRAGGPVASWSTLGAVNNIAWLLGWSEEKTFGIPPNNRATVTSCFYLLVKYSMASPKQFVCKGDDNVMLFRPSIFSMPPQNGIFSTWDFGDGAQVWPGECCSYSYHMPFSFIDPRPGHGGDMTNFAVEEVSSGTRPLCADRNPFLDENAINPEAGDNCAAHGGDGQNVLYRDLHVSFEKNPNVGIGEDNIWTYYDGSNDQPPTFIGDDGPPINPEDAYLVNEYQQGNLP